MAGAVYRYAEWSRKIRANQGTGRDIGRGRVQNPWRDRGVWQQRPAHDKQVSIRGKRGPFSVGDPRAARARWRNREHRSGKSPAIRYPARTGDFPHSVMWGIGLAGIKKKVSTWAEGRTFRGVRASRADLYVDRLHLRAILVHANDSVEKTWGEPGTFAHIELSVWSHDHPLGKFPIICMDNGYRG